MQRDIGIITPYNRQAKVIKDLLISHNYTLRPKLNQIGRPSYDIAVGSVEMFQGSERKIIIVSTVRSFGSLGFLTCPQRFNVAVTRAKELLIVIGNAKSLAKDENWGTLIHYAQRRGNLVYKRHT